MTDLKETLAGRGASVEALREYSFASRRGELVGPLALSRRANPNGPRESDGVGGPQVIVADGPGPLRARCRAGGE
ncbi:hypothetical protein AGRA3207_001637 [Actinomadura graeca]|uniref:Uncharacterized protein n=1 Tax=Actinomadura graeca TaxID=2750812 RepID=A0ABX8QQ77_9ACTN|nr:hypothetical protein [Actinomadura graeca]QXJ20851.1 hypothetical protein AGRA3207_001637 [Actinomadura graeca]